MDAGVVDYGNGTSRGHCFAAIASFSRIGTGNGEGIGRLLCPSAGLLILWRICARPSLREVLPALPHRLMDLEANRHQGYGLDCRVYVGHGLYVYVDFKYGHSHYDVAYRHKCAWGIERGETI